MQDKLSKLWAHIGLKATDYSYFTGGELVKLVINDKKQRWVFKVKIKTTLPLVIYQEVNELLGKAYSDLNEVIIEYEVETINEDLINEYYDYFIKLMGKNNLMVFRGRSLSVDGVLMVEAFNQVEADLLKPYLSQLKKSLKRAGFTQALKVIVNEEKREALKAEIRNEMLKRVVVPKNKITKVIYGEGKGRGRVVALSDIISEMQQVVVEAYVFGLDFFVSVKSGFKIITIKINDLTDSLVAKIFTRDEDEFTRLKACLKIGDWYRFSGYVKNDKYSRDLVLNLRDIIVIEAKMERRMDNAPLKRVELHAHTHLSQMDGLVSVKDLIKRAEAWGHDAIAITDHNSCQGFPEAYRQQAKIKVIYGAEVGMIDDAVEIVLRGHGDDLIKTTYVVFDLETTGLNATSGDSIIEVGAVKLCDGEIIDKFQALIDPGVKLPAVISKITGITDEMLKGQQTEEEVLKQFQTWIGALPLVAHNAKFDLSFLESAYEKYQMGVLTNTVIDTLELSRALDPGYNRHSLAQIVKRYEVEFDEDRHHRAIYDAEKTALVLVKMLVKLKQQNFNKIDELNDLVAKDELHKFGRVYHLTLLVKNNTGLKNLFKIMTLMNTKYLERTPRILRSEIVKYREGLLIGSGCSEGEVFTLARSKTDEELNQIIQFYDYIEIQPPAIYSPLIQMKSFQDETKLIEHLQKIIRLAQANNKLVVATGDVHHLDESDKVFREVIINQKVPGGGLHPLKREAIKEIPSQHLLTTAEMLEAFSFLGEALANEIVITNSRIIARQIESVQVIKDELYTPTMEKSGELVKTMVAKGAKALYGEPLPLIVARRIEEELNSIIGNGFDVIYLIAAKLVKKSNDDGYIVGSRGSVGSSLVATLMGITEVNPLPPHYVCPQCQASVFTEAGVSLGEHYASGYDLPPLTCSCGTPMKQEGQDMPFATFLGFKGDKVPDIDLNFSGDYQAKAHNYTRELFGAEKVFRAGTIGTVASKTAFGFVKGYMEAKDIHLSMAEQDRLALGCTGVKRTTGQHPGGIIVIPEKMDIFDFTPYQYPADDTSASWYTTHFDFHAIDNNVLKLDILGHDDPTVLKMLADLTRVKLETIPFNDEKVLSLFTGPDALGVTKEQILCKTGTLGIPEFKTRFVMEMLTDTKPKTFAELVKISGLSHGTDVWLGNARDLIRQKICAFKDVIGCRDDIMTYLMYEGLEPIDAFNIMEFVRKGKASKEPLKWKEYVALMKGKKIPQWYIEACSKIKYMFPKAHATAYVMMALRVAWFKVYYPLYYYAALFSINLHDYELETMQAGYEQIKVRINALNNKGFGRTNKDEAVLECLENALEMTARGFKFGELDLLKSEASKFLVDEEKQILIPPFQAIDGLGTVVANNIIKEREKGPFISIEDLQSRAKVSQTTIDKMQMMGVLTGLPVSSQMSLFEL